MEFHHCTTKMQELFLVVLEKWWWDAKLTAHHILWFKGICLLGPGILPECISRIGRKKRQYNQFNSNTALTAVCVYYFVVSLALQLANTKWGSTYWQDQHFVRLSHRFHYSFSILFCNKVQADHLTFHVQKFSVKKCTIVRRNSISHP